MDQAELIVPPLTPFDDEQNVDEGLLAKHIDYVVDTCNASMVVAAGVEAQEYHYLTMEQRKRLIACTIDGVAGRRPVAVGISHPSFRVAVELAHYAETLGAQAVQLLAPLRPFGGAPTRTDLLAYFERIGKETRLPILLYLNPGPGADVSIADTIALARLEQVRYIKESSRDLSRVGRLIAEIDRAGLAKYYTTMQMLLITMQLGGSGVTLPPPAAQLANAIVQAYARKDMEEAARLQQQFSVFPAQWMHRGLTPTMKAALKIMGRSVGDPYPPYAPLDDGEVQALSAYLKTTDLS